MTEQEQNPGATSAAAERDRLRGQESRPQTAIAAGTQCLADVSDDALLERMRAMDRLAWREFMHRFRPVLVNYARRARVPDDALPQCIDDVLADEALRLVTPGARHPVNLRAYLMRAARSKFANHRRAAGRQQRRHVDATDADSLERVVLALHSTYSRRAGAGTFSDLGQHPADASDREPVRHDDAVTAGDSPGDARGGADTGSEPADSDTGARVLATVVARLYDAMSTEERVIVGWLSERVPHRQIAAWLGVSYDAATKRAWRLVHRLRAEVAREAAALPAEERDELARFLRRVGATGPVAHGPTKPRHEGPAPEGRTR